MRSVSWRATFEAIYHYSDIAPPSLLLQGNSSSRSSYKAAAPMLAPCNTPCDGSLLQSMTSIALLATGSHHYSHAATLSLSPCMQPTTGRPMSDHGAAVRSGDDTARWTAARWP